MPACLVENPRVVDNISTYSRRRAGKKVIAGEKGPGYGLKR
jgi:hypothetical protein